MRKNYSLIIFIVCIICLSTTNLPAMPLAPATPVRHQIVLNQLWHTVLNFVPGGGLGGGTPIIIKYFDIEDLDGDNFDEFIVQYPRDMVCINGRLGTAMWDFLSNFSGFKPVAPTLTSDFDGDGFGDILVFPGTASSSVLGDLHLLSSRTGAIIQSYPGLIQSSIEKLNGIETLDINGDGNKDILMLLMDYSGSPNSFVQNLKIFDGLTGSLIRSTQVYQSTSDWYGFDQISIIDRPSQNLKILVLSKHMQVGSQTVDGYDSSTGTLLWTVPINHQKRTQIFKSSPLGDMDLIISSIDPPPATGTTITRLNGYTGQVMWTTTTAGPYSPYNASRSDVFLHQLSPSYPSGGFFTYANAIASYDEGSNRIDYRPTSNGHIFWSVNLPLTTPGTYNFDMTLPKGIYDLDNDGYNEIAVLESYHVMKFLTTRDGSVIFTFNSPDYLDSANNLGLQTQHKQVLIFGRDIVTGSPTITALEAY